MYLKLFPKFNQPSYCCDFVKRYKNYTKSFNAKTFEIPYIRRNISIKLVLSIF